MSNAVAKVSFLQGQAWAKTADGSWRALTVGSTLNDDEVLVTAKGARIELDTGTGEPLVINGGLTVGMSRDLLAQTATEADEALLSDASVQEALTVLEQGGDLLEELEETAAGNSGGGSSEGHSFVQLTRLIETTDSRSFDYSSASPASREQVISEGEYTNRTPLVTDQQLSFNEDEPFTGQIIAEDIEGDAITFTLTTPPANGVVTLDPVTGQFTFTPNANYNGSDSFVVTVTDSHGNSADTSISLNIAPVNDVPTTADLSLTTNEDIPVSGQVQAQDIEGDTLSYSLSGQPTNGSVVLDPATGAFVYTPNPNYNGGDSFVVTTSDGKGGTTTSTIAIGVIAVNDLPVSSNQNLATSEDTPIASQITATDVDGDILDYAVSGQPANGTVSLNPATGGFVYTPNPNYNGGDSFVVTISDGKGGTTTSTITIGVAPVNDAPTSNNLNLTTPEDTSISGQVSTSDVESDSLSFSISGNPANGSVVINTATGSFTYIPNANYNGGDSFTVTISDGNGGTTTSLVSVGVTPVNDLPVASNLNLTTDEDTSVTGAISASDADGDTVSFTVSGNPANGNVVLNPTTGGFNYTPNAGYNGGDSFVVTVSDGNGGTTTSTVTIGVNPVNDAPIANNDIATTDEDTAVTIAVRGNDTDAEGNNLAVTGVTQGANGSVVIDAVTGNPVYTPNAGFSGSDSFSYTISDGNGGTSTATVNVTVTAVNDAPVANNDIATTDEDTAVTIAVRGNDTDPEGNLLTVSAVTQGANGSVVIDAVTGNPVYTPNASFSGSDSFTYTISDGNGGTATATVNVTVNAVNDAPVANNDTATTDEDTAVTIAVRGNDTDPEGDNVTVSSVTQGANGSVVIDAVSGNPVYTPNAGFSGSDSFTYTINDGNGGTATATVNVTVNAVNDAPVANNDTATTNEDTAVTIAVRGNDTDPEGDNVTVSSVTQGANGSVVIDAVSGNPVYTPNANFSGSDSFTYTISDGNGGTATATVNITVTPVNDAPVGVDDSINIAEGGTATVLVGGANNLLTNDADAENSPLTAVLVSGPTNGTLTLNANGTFSYTHNGSETTVDSFTYRANDGTTNGNLVTVNIKVTPVNDAPQTNAITATGNEDTLVTINLAGTDVDGTVVGFVIKSLPASGVLYSDSLMATVVAVGDLVSGPVYFMPNANWNGSTNLTYAAQDNLGLEDATPATVSITVNPVADAAVLGSGTGAVKEDTPAQSSATGLLSITDPDAGQSAFHAQTNTSGSYGSFSVNSAGSWTYNIDNSKPAVQVLKEGEVKTETFTVTSLDGTTTSVVITVTGTNEAPVANDDIAAATAASNIGLVSEYFGYSDTVNGPNLSSVEQIYSFINGRIADATFIAKTFDYGASSSFGNNLGTGTNLQSFLGSDAASLSTDPATTSDAIIRMRGFVELGAGTYNFKVTADDGYQIRVDGVVIAERNLNQSVTTTTHTQFTLAAGGIHTVEIIYWDQGSNARLKVELSDDAGASYELLSSVPAYQHTLFSAVEDTALSIPASSFLANDTDSDGDTLSIQSVQGAVNGSVSLVAGSVVFTPAANYSGPASFTYTISDGNGGTATATVNLAVAPVNDAPVAVNNSLTLAPNATLNIPIATLLANDTDVDGDKLTIVSVQSPVNGSVSISGSNVVFTPSSSTYEGPASFTYTVRDPMGATNTASVNVTVGAATAPSLVVVKSLLSVAHGTAGASVKFPITTALVDTDGSESISVRISGVPTGATFNAGTNLGSGVWLMQESDLPNLMLNLPGSYSTGGTNLTVQVIATEINGGATASVSNTVMLYSGYTTVDKTTTISGNLTGTSANEYIVGGDGDNVITGGNGNDVIYGGAGNDTLSASTGSDMFYGGAGNDVITGSTGLDRISGGSGNDTMSGGVDTTVDVFVWSLGDQGSTGTPAMDTINNFVTTAAGSNHTGGDVLDLRDLLIGEHVGAKNAAGNLADYLHFEVAGGSTTIHISHTGGFGADSHTVSAGYTSSAETQKIVLNGVDLQGVYSGATTDQQIITQLLNNNKLITD